VNEARRRQLELFRSWSPEERLRRGLELSALCLEVRDARLRQQHPEASEEELRRLRLEEVLAQPSIRLE
jgi:hypothetical protein